MSWNGPADASVVGVGLRKGLHQPCLPDTGLARNENDRAEIALGLSKRRTQDLEVAFALKKVHAHIVLGRDRPGFTSCF